MYVIYIHFVKAAASATGFVLSRVDDVRLNILRAIYSKLFVLTANYDFEVCNQL